IVGQSVRTSPQLAALANGVAGHAMDYDISYISGQVMAALVPAVLPVAEITKASAAELMAAHIIGAEVSGRIARANFRASSIGGWHTTGMVGVFAAAAAAARLLKLPVDAIPDVLGISASLASGITVNFGTMTKPLHSGQAARAGTQYPSTVEAAKFSVAYLVPYALIHGAPRISAFTEAAIADDRIKALARTVTASVDPDLGPGTDGSPARIRITFADGQVIEQYMEHSSGSRGKPMTEAQI